MPAFQPYRGKPAVRNDGEGRGNVGIIRSPVRASTLPDCGGWSAMTIPTAIKPIPGRRRCFERGRQHVSDAPSQGPNGPAWSKNLACAEAPWTGTGRSHVWPAAVHRSGPHREGEEP